MSILLSGWLPREQGDGLSRLHLDLVERFEAAYQDGDDTPVQVVVVAVLTCETVRHHRNPDDHPPALAMKFAAIEPAEGRRAEQLRWVLAALKSERSGQPALDGFDAAVAAIMEGKDVDLPPAPAEVVDEAADPDAD